jgi:hypothetical protein
MYAIEATVTADIPWIFELLHLVARWSVLSTELGEVNTYLKAC